VKKSFSKACRIRSRSEFLKSLKRKQSDIFIGGNELEYKIPFYIPWLMFSVMNGTYKKHYKTHFLKRKFFRTLFQKQSKRKRLLNLDWCFFPFYANTLGAEKKLKDWQNSPLNQI